MTCKDCYFFVEGTDDWKAICWCSITKEIVFPSETCPSYQHKYSYADCFENPMDE